MGPMSLSDANEFCQSQNKALLTKELTEIDIFSPDIVDDGQLNASRIWTGSIRHNRTHFINEFGKIFQPRQNGAFDKFSLNFASVVIGQLQNNSDIYFVNENEQMVIGYDYYFCLCYQSNLNVLEAHAFVITMATLIMAFSVIFTLLHCKRPNFSFIS